MDRNAKSLKLEPTVPGDLPSCAARCLRAARRGDRLQPVVRASLAVYRSPSSTTLASRRCMLAFVVGGLARSASSRSDIAGWRRRSRAASCSGLEQRLERAGGAKAARRVELALGRVGRADEVRVVGVRKPVRLGAHLRDHAPLLEREHGVDDTGGEQVALDLLPPLRVGARVGITLADLQPNLLGRGDASQERRSGRRRRPHLEVRRPRAGERAAAEERAAQVGATAARAGHDASRRAVERQVVVAEHARLGEHAERASPSRRRGAGSALRDRRIGRCRCGSPPGRAARPGARTRDARPPMTRGRGGTRRSRGRGDAPRRRCGTAPRSPPADRSVASARSPPARP